MNTLQILPIGDSSFESIRQGNCLYVDKTRHFFQMATQGKYYFLSRPRRFGKSLTISTLRCLFQGRRDLFEGLWVAENTAWKWQEHPVILLDFNGISHETPENLKEGLSLKLDDAAALHGIQLDITLLKEKFRQLILSLYRKTGMQVVILMDEYDKPLIDHLGKGPSQMDIARANRDALKHFLGVIKDGDVADALRFVFITGVSKFSRVSIFSELNNLEDLTMVDEYADMLGCTQEEMETCFNPYIGLLAEKRGESYSQVMGRLEEYYNGYRFSKR